jgi:general secretion pathway protein A
MTAEETLPYLEHRLNLAGWTGNPKFTPDAALALHQASGGVPRKLNTLATRTLLMGSVERAAVIDGPLVGRVLKDLSNETPRPVVASTPAANVGEAESVAAGAMVDDSRLLDHEARIAMLEAQIQEQEAALRRVLTLLVDWVERDETMARASAA